MLRNLIVIIYLFCITQAFGAQWAENLTLKDGKLLFKQSDTATATPPLGYSSLYSPTDNFLYFQDSTGIIRNVLLGGSAFLNDLIDVDTTTATTAQALVFDGVTWKGEDIIIADIDDITNVDTTTATVNEFLKFDGTKWVNSVIPIIDKLDDIGDVDTTGVVTGNVLGFDGTNWVPSTGGKTLVGEAPIVITQDTNTATISLGEVDYLDFDTGVSPIAKNGRLFWDNTNNTLAFHVDAASGVIGQINEELWVEAINLTGVQINDGQVVYINGASTGFPTIALANAANYDKTIGVATQNIANGAMGKITTKGTIGSFDTSGYTAGDVLFLSDLVAGSLTNVRPASNIVQVAKVLNSQVNGKLLVDVLPPTDDQTLDPTGFLDPTLASVAYDYTTRQVTLTGTYKAVWKGSPVDILNGPWTSPAHTATNGNWFLYYDGVSVVWSQTPWTFNQLMIAAVYYDGTANSYGMVETHGVMDWRVHRNNHLTIGTFLLSGGDLSDYTPASTTPAARRPLVSTEVVLDEDVSTTIPAIASESYNQFYLSGVATGNFAFSQTDIIPVTGSRPNYNQFTGGVWAQTPLTANAYAAVWLIAIPVTTDANSQKFRFLWIQPQSESTTLATIQALSPSSVNLNGLNTVSPEIVFTAKIIVRYVAGGTNNWTIISAEKLVGTKISQSTVTGAFLTSVSTNATLTGDGNVATPLSVADPVTTADRNVLNSFSIVNSVTTNVNSMGFTDNRFFYFGDETMDGTIRIKQSGGALIYEKRVGGTYIEISRLDNL